MNSSLVDELLSQLQGAPAGQMAQQLGTDQNTAANAIAAALPMILGALGNNAQQPGGANALLNALQRDHAGAMDLGGMLGGLLGGGQASGAGGMGGLSDLLGGLLGGAAPASKQMDAGGILDHIFGSAQPRAESVLGQATGMSSGQAGNLLKILAPMVMAALAKQVTARNMDADSLGNVLGQERAQVQNQGGLGGGLLNAVLDENGDGKLDIGDLLKIGGSLLGGRR